LDKTILLTKSRFYQVENYGQSPQASARLDKIAVLSS